MIGSYGRDQFDQFLLSMRVLLHNFRSYTKTEYSFEQGKITLVTGSSGTGKSTIFEAIDWCLYGKKRGIYNNQAPKEKCYVALLLSDLLIYRQGHPSLLRVLPVDRKLSKRIRLMRFSEVIEYLTELLPKMSVSNRAATPSIILPPSPSNTSSPITLSFIDLPNFTAAPLQNVQTQKFSLPSAPSPLYYDGDTAQEMLNKQFGNRSLWLPSSYMVQGTHCELLTKSNAERMEILNSLSFLSEDPASYISKIQARLVKINSELHDVQIEFRTESNVLNSELLRKPIQDAWKQDLYQQANLKQEMVTVQHHITELQSKLKQYRKYESKQQRLLVEQQGFVSSIAQANTQQNSLKIQLDGYLGDFPAELRQNVDSYNIVELPNLLPEITKELQKRDAHLQQEQNQNETVLKVQSEALSKQQQTLAAKLATLESSVAVEIGSQQNRQSNLERELRELEHSQAMKQSSSEKELSNLRASLLRVQSLEEQLRQLEVEKQIAYETLQGLNDFKSDYLSKTWSSTNLSYVRELEVTANQGKSQADILGVNYQEAALQEARDETATLIAKYNAILNYRRVEQQILELQGRHDQNRKILSSKLSELGLAPDTSSSQISQLIEQITAEISTGRQSQNLLQCPHCYKYVRYLSPSLVPSETEPISEDSLKSMISKDSVYRELIPLFNQGNSLQAQINTLSRSLPSIDSSLNKGSSSENFPRRGKAYESFVSEVNVKLQELQQKERALSSIRIVIPPHPPSSVIEALINYQSLLGREQTLQHQLGYTNSVELANKIAESESILSTTHVEYQQSMKELQEQLQACQQRIVSLRAPLSEEGARVRTELKHSKQQLTDLSEKSRQEQARISSQRIEISGRIQTLTALLVTLSQWNTYASNLQQKVDDVLKKIEDVKHEMAVFGDQNPNEQITALNEKLPSLKAQIEGIDYYLSIEARRKQLDSKSEQIERLRQDVEALTRLKDIAVDAECYQLQSTVDDINATMNEILAEIFENPISVELRLFKALKSKKGITKPTINLMIRYKNVEYDGISGLSGGEGDRVSLALTLALNLVSPSPFLILDESLSSLDATARERCLNIMRRIFAERGELKTEGEQNKDKGKIILCVNHEDVEGSYDRVLRVGSA